MRFHLHSEGDPSQFAPALAFAPARACRAAGREPTEFDAAPRDDAACRVHVSLNAAPTRAVACMAAADALVLSASDSAFSVVAAALARAPAAHVDAPSRHTPTAGAKFKELLRALTPRDEWVAISPRGEFDAARFATLAVASMRARRGAAAARSRRRRRARER